MIFAWVVLPCAVNALCATPDDAMRAAGYDLDGATSEPPRRDDLFSRHCYETFYRLRSGLVVSLKLDAETSQTVDLTGRIGRGPRPTSDTATLTAEWARQVLLRMNVHQVPQGQVHLGAPTIEYSRLAAAYEILFPRTDAHGHVFAQGCVRFCFDHGTSRVTSLMASFDWPEPSVTTGTMISEDQATSIALAAVNSHKSLFFQYVPEKMAFDRTTDTVAIFVQHRNNMWSPYLLRLQDLEKTNGTAVCYCVRFRSRKADPTYTGIYERITVLVFVDAFSGELAGGDYGRSVILGKQ
jgi:hypothetical protein